MTNWIEKPKLNGLGLTPTISYNWASLESLGVWSSLAPLIRSDQLEGEKGLGFDTKARQGKGNCSRKKHELLEHVGTLLEAEWLVISVIALYLRTIGFLSEEIHFIERTWHQKLFHIVAPSLPEETNE